MSARQPPTPEELADQAGLDADTAQAIADGMQPLQDLTDVGATFGGALEGMPGTGPRFVAIVLQNAAAQVNLASTSVEALARGLELYFDAQAGSLETLFPPPQQIAAHAGEQAMPLVRAIDRLGETGGL